MNAFEIEVKINPKKTISFTLINGENFENKLKKISKENSLTN